MKKWIFAVGCACLCACGPRSIPGLEIDVPDTPDGRAIVEVLRRFQQAYEQKDIEAIVALAASGFFENCGNNDPSDDYDRDGLRQHFTEYFKSIEKPALTITLKDVRLEKDRATVDYQFLARYLMKLPSGERWQVEDELQRMQLVKEDGTWKVVSGL